MLPLLLEDVAPLLLDDVVPLLLEDALPLLLDDGLPLLDECPPLEDPALPDELPPLEEPSVPERMAGAQAVSERPTAMIHTHRSCMSIPLSRHQKRTPDAAMGAGDATEGGRRRNGSPLHRDGCS